MKKVMGCVEIYDDFISKEEADLIIKECEELGKNTIIPDWNWGEATHGTERVNGKESKYRTNDMLNISSLALIPYGTDVHRALDQKKSLHLKDNMSSIHNMISAKLQNYVASYCDKYRFNIQFDEGYAILRYTEGQEYKPHADYSENLPRYLSALILLNPSEYEGGGTYFNHFDEEVKPDKPSLVLFPANYAYTHQALPVTSGTKYAIVTWLGHQLDIANMPPMWLPNDLQRGGNIPV
jgi:hypothetical protein